MERNSRGQYVTGQSPSKLALYAPGATVTDIRQFTRQTTADRMARVRARRREQATEDAAIEAAIDAYVKDHRAGWSQYMPPSFDDEGPSAA